MLWWTVVQLPRSNGRGVVAEMTDGAEGAGSWIVEDEVAAVVEIDGEDDDDDDGFDDDGLSISNDGEGVWYICNWIGFDIEGGGSGSGNGSSTWWGRDWCISKEAEWESSVNGDMDELTVAEA